MESLFPSYPPKTVKVFKPFPLGVLGSSFIEIIGDIKYFSSCDSEWIIQFSAYKASFFAECGPCSQWGLNLGTELFTQSIKFAVGIWTLQTINYRGQVIIAIIFSAELSIHFLIADWPPRPRAGTICEPLLSVALFQARKYTVINNQLTWSAGAK